MPHYDYDNSGSIGMQSAIQTTSADADHFYVFVNENGPAVDVQLQAAANISVFEVIRNTGVRETFDVSGTNPTFHTFRMDGDESVTLRVQSSATTSNGWDVQSVQTVHGVAGSRGRGHTGVASNTLAARLTVATV